MVTQAHCPPFDLWFSCRILDGYLLPFKNLGLNLMNGPLSHIRVLDLSRVLAGPWAAQNLADLGANVIKIERPGEGDDTRKWGPPYLKDRDGHETGETAYNIAANRNKRSVTIDLAKPEGALLARKLALKSDILIENFRVGGAVKFGLGYDDLAVNNPGLIYCSITGFGQDGPYKDRGGYDFIIQAIGGLMSITGEPAEKGGGPQKVGLAVSDLFTGMYATVALLAAVTHRERTGEGQYIDLALLDCTAAMLSMMATNYFISGKSPVRMGNAHPNVTPYGLYDTADGHLVVAVGNDRQFARLCDVLGLSEFASDPRFISNARRLANRTAMDAVLCTTIKQWDRKELQDALNGALVPCGAVNSISEVFDDPHIKHRGIKTTLRHPLSETVSLAGSPIRLSKTPVTYRRPPPLLGEHTEEVLSDDLGIEANEIARLRSEAVI